MNGKVNGNAEEEESEEEEEPEPVSATLVCTATRIPFMYSFSRNLPGLSPNFRIQVSVSDLYIPRIPAVEQADQSWEYINRLKKNKCGNWDCGPAIPFLGIFDSNFPYWFFAECFRPSRVCLRRFCSTDMT